MKFNAYCVTQGILFFFFSRCRLFVWLTDGQTLTNSIWCAINRFFPCLHIFPRTNVYALNGWQKHKYCENWSCVIHQFSEMPDSCCRVGCPNPRSKGSVLRFYRIPFRSDDQSLELRKKWVTAIKRDKWTEKLLDNARICSTHFLSGAVYYFYVGYI